MNILVKKVYGIMKILPLRTSDIWMCCKKNKEKDEHISQESVWNNENTSSQNIRQLNVLQKEQGKRWRSSRKYVELFKFSQYFVGSLKG